MAKFRIKPGSKKKAQAEMQAFAERKKKAIKFALGFWMDDTVAAMQAELLAIGAYDQGLLSAATTRDPVREEDGKAKCKGHNDSEHATVVEWGRLPKSGLPPPLLPLVGWAGRKGIISALPRNISFDGTWAKKWAASGAIFRNMKKNKGSKKQKSTPLDPQIRDLIIVRAIANKIFQKGIAGRHPFAIVWDRRAPTISKDVASLVRLSK